MMQNTVLPIDNLVLWCLNIFYGGLLFNKLTGKKVRIVYYIIRCRL